MPDTRFLIERALANAPGGPLRAFLDGLVCMTRDLILDRLPLMMLVKHVAGKRRHADEAYPKAHRLHEMLTTDQR